ncbi:MAG: hypothetical protein J6Q00_04355, partial [Verrucomicrobia bacterium]|nr:hypothetical protein [Verrucomicrobiota bacterium]
MIQDVYEPLSRYRDEFRSEFAWRAEEKFEELTRASGIDVEANRRLIEEIRMLVDHAEEARGKRSFFGCLFVLLVAGAVVAFIAAYNEMGNPAVLVPLGIIGIIASLFLISPHKKASQLYKELKKTIEVKKDAAWKQMEPLNALYTWDIPVKLIQATVPRLEFDPYFTNERLWSLQRRYGWNDDFNRDKSILFAQSGLINGNPFVFGEYRYMKWENHVYKGTKEISWTEQERDSKGNYHTVTHHETLEATVTKPEPVYKSKKLLIYGNDAAPNLSFSRTPSDLSKGDEGLFARLRKKHEIRRLQKFSQNLEDESQFTLMSNHDFEALFHAVDRDNEVEFRLLFTSLAQIQMLDLLKDKSVGYGDDFTFRKKKKINLLTSTHLDKTSIDTDPKRFYDWDYDRAKANFQGLNEEYFKNIYFSLAPLLAIPLYQQTRTHEEIWKDVLRGRESSFWEHETLANYYGYGQFKHPDCVT